MKAPLALKFTDSFGRWVVLKCVKCVETCSNSFATWPFTATRQVAVGPERRTVTFIDSCLWTWRFFVLHLRRNAREAAAHEIDWVSSVSCVLVTNSCGCSFRVYHLGRYFFGDFFFFGPLVPWSSGPLVPWSSGPLILWSPGPLV